MCETHRDNSWEVHNTAGGSSCDQSRYQSILEVTDIQKSWAPMWALQMEFAVQVNLEKYWGGTRLKELILHLNSLSLNLRPLKLK